MGVKFEFNRTLIRLENACRVDGLDNSRTITSTVLDRALANILLSVTVIP